MTSGVVTFDYTAWSTMYPLLAASVDSGEAQGYFNQATLYLDNTGCSAVMDLTKRAVILDMLTAHMAKLFATIDGQPPSPLVGRISNAAEGSVSVATEFPMNASNAWFNQTPYGAAAYQALLPYRTGFYAVAPQIPLAAQSWPGIGSPYGFGGFGWLR